MVLLGVHVRDQPLLKTARSDEAELMTCDVDNSSTGVLGVSKKHVNLYCTVVFYVNFSPIFCMHCFAYAPEDQIL